MLLLRNGLIHTMGAAGSIQGDILLEDGLIRKVAQHIDIQDAQVIDGQGLQICPGLIDAHIHLIRASNNEEKDCISLCADALASGVTTQALWPEESGQCRVYHGRDEVKAPAAPIRRIEPEGFADAALRQIMASAAAAGERLGCEIYGERQLRRVLSMQKETNCALVLTHLTECEHAVSDIAASGCEVIMGACMLRSGSSAYALAAQLMKAGVALALTSDYPATRLHHLPLSAGLCVRSGMAHEAAIRAITINAARLLRVENVCGSIEAGKRADLTIFDGDPLLLATGRVMTISAGQIVEGA